MDRDVWMCALVVSSMAESRALAQCPERSDEALAAVELCGSTLRWIASPNEPPCGDAVSSVIYFGAAGGLGAEMSARFRELGRTDLSDRVLLESERHALSIERDPPGKGWRP